MWFSCLPATPQELCSWAWHSGESKAPPLSFPALDFLTAWTHLSHPVLPRCRTHDDGRPGSMARGQQPPLSVTLCPHSSQELPFNDSLDSRRPTHRAQCPALTNSSSPAQKEILISKAAQGCHPGSPARLFPPLRLPRFSWFLTIALDF